MDLIYRLALMAGLFVLSTPVYALECDITFRAKKVDIDNYWYGRVEKPKFTSGRVTAKGATRSLCVSNGLMPYREAGWKITWKKVLVTKN